MKKLAIPLSLVLLTLFVGSRLSDRFLDFAYLMEAATLLAEIGILAIAMNFVIGAGHIDLSVGSILVLTACLSAKLMNAGFPPGLVLPLTLILGGGLGAINGWLITALKTPSFLVTVGTMALYRGIAQAMMGPRSEKFPSALNGLDTFAIAEISIPIWILVLFAASSLFVFSRTVLGRWILAVGSNPSAALYSGIPTDRVIRLVFILSGTVSAIAALMMNSRLGVARFDLARGAELDVITIAVVGGTAIKGGEVNILGGLFAFFLISFMRTAMGVANIAAEYQLTAVGILLILAVIINQVSFESIRKNFAQRKAAQRKTTQSKTAK